MVAYDKVAVEADLAAGKTVKEIMAIHNLRLGQANSIAYAWKKAGGKLKPKAKKEEKEEEKTEELPPPPPPEEPEEEPEPEPSVPLGGEEWFDLSNQIFSQMSQKSKSAEITAIVKGVPIKMFEPLYNIPFIPMAMYGQIEASDKRYVNAKKIKAITLSGYDLTKDASRDITLKPEKIIIKPLGEDVFKASIENAVEVAKKIKKSGKWMEPMKLADYSYFGAMTPDDFEKYLTFFDVGTTPIEFFAWYWSDQSKGGPKKREETDTGHKMVMNNGYDGMKAYIEFMRNINKYYTHYLFMEYLNGALPEGIDEIAKKEGIHLDKGPVNEWAKEFNKGVIAGGSAGLFDPRPNVGESPNQDTQIVKAMDLFLDAAKKISPEVITIDDVRIYSYFRFYLKKGSFHHANTYINYTPTNKVELKPLLKVYKKGDAKKLDKGTSTADDKPSKDAKLFLYATVSIKFITELMEKLTIGKNFKPYTLCSDVTCETNNSSGKPERTAIPSGTPTCPKCGKPAPAPTIHWTETDLLKKAEYWVKFNENIKV